MSKQEKSELLQAFERGDSKTALNLIKNGARIRDDELKDCCNAAKDARSEARKNIGGMIVDMLLSAISAAFDLHLDAARKSIKDNNVGNRFVDKISETSREIQDYYLLNK